MPSVPGTFTEIDQSLIRTLFNRNQIEEGDRKEKNAFQVLEAGPLDGIPLIIITSSDLNGYEDGRKNQAERLEWSSDSKQILVDGAGHAVHWHDPASIHAAIQDLLHEIETRPLTV